MKEDNDPYEYEVLNTDCSEEGTNYPGDQCPNCGDCLHVNDTVFDSRGRSHTLGKTDPQTGGDPLWCKECWDKIARQVKAENNHTIEEYL